jgi:hypothetical protein
MIWTSYADVGSTANFMTCGERQQLSPIGLPSAVVAAISSGCALSHRSATTSVPRLRGAITNRRHGRSAGGSTCAGMQVDDSRPVTLAATVSSSPPLRSGTTLATLSATAVCRALSLLAWHPQPMSRRMSNGMGGRLHRRAHLHFMASTIRAGSGCSLSEILGISQARVVRP